MKHFALELLILFAAVFMARCGHAQGSHGGPNRAINGDGSVTIVDSGFGFTIPSGYSAW